MAPTGGGPGLGFAATGGGGLPAAELDGLELAGVPELDVSVDAAGFFHGAAEPLPAAMPGKTDTGLALTLAVTDCRATLALGAGAAAGLATGVVAAGTGRLAGGGGGGGGGAEADLGLAGTRTR